MRHHPLGNRRSQPMSDPTHSMTDLVDMFTLGVRELLEKLDDDLLRRVALGKLEGYQNLELAHQLGIAERTVERKLQLIRRKWQGEWES